jgi:long-chain acyl-CoA synthetase
MSGKNIEPQPIEGALEQSPLIKHALLLGQDKRELGALVFPDEEALAAGSSSSSSSAVPGGSGLGDAAALQRVLAAEVAHWNAARPDYHPEDHIGHIQVGLRGMLVPCAAAALTRPCAAAALTRPCAARGCITCL